MQPSSHDPSATPLAAPPDTTPDLGSSDDETTAETRQAKTRERTCAGCGKKADPEELVRIVLGPEEQEGPEHGGAVREIFAQVAVDFAGGGIGRGAHVHPALACIARAANGGFGKSFKTKVRASAEEIAKDIVRGSERAVLGLVGAAVSRRLVGIGADAAKEAMRAGAPLLLVAADAGSVAGEFGSDIAAGRARVLSDKATLGKSCGKAEVAVLAITDQNIAEAIARAASKADSVRMARSEAWSSPEVR